MKVGIVGGEGAKFTPLGKEHAFSALYDILDAPEITHVVSGHCHLGGVDIWAEEVAKQKGLELEIYPPKKLNWSEGYKPRNLEIANHSDILYCVTVDVLPEGYKGMRFTKCYHCARINNPKQHIKSGGCWTVIQGMKLGKTGHWIVVENY